MLLAKNIEALQATCDPETPIPEAKDVKYLALQVDTLALLLIQVPPLPTQKLCPAHRNCSGLTRDAQPPVKTTYHHREQCALVVMPSI